MAISEKPTESGIDGHKPDGEGGRVVSVGAEHRGRGRPPGAANKPKPETSVKSGKADPGLDPGIIGDLFVSLSEIGDDLFVMAILARARAKLSPDIYPKFGEEMNRVRLGEKDKNLIRAGAVALAKKYTFLTSWGPELIILVVAVQYTARMGNAFRKINSLPDYVPAETP